MSGVGVFIVALTTTVVGARLPYVYQVLLCAREYKKA